MSKSSQVIAIEQASLEAEGRVLSVLWRDGVVARFHSIWLLDCARDPLTRDSENGQKLKTIGDIPEHVVIKHVEVTDDRVSLEFRPGESTVEFEAAWLRTFRYDTNENNRYSGWLSAGRETWGADNASLTTIDFDQLRKSSSKLEAWLEEVHRSGFAIATNCPVESGALMDVVDLFGFVRETNYGRWFDVRAEVNPSNLAYTGLGLQGHTDNPYRDPVPTMQILFCLENSAKGGETILIDGFHIARRLRDESPDDFELLSTHCANFEYAGGEEVRLRSRNPMIELAPDGELRAIRFNNRSIAPLVDVPYDRMEAYYGAYRRFAGLVDDPDMGVRFKLEPGSCLVFDNTRVLHSRSAYSGAGSRWLQGCYADLDGLRSKLAVLQSAGEGQ